LTLPVLLDFSPKTTSATRFHVFTGPQVSLHTKAEVGTDGEWVEVDDEVKGTDFGWALGVGVSSGRFNADASYALGLSNIAKEGDKVKNRVFSVLRPDLSFFSATCRPIFSSLASQISPMPPPAGERTGL
jgi:hypothetical protein